MTGAEVNPKSFLKRYRRNTQRLVNIRNKLAERMLSDDIHELRVTVRRVQMICKLLPKDTRGSQAVRDYESITKTIFRATTRLRDIDILIKTLGQLRTPLSEEKLRSLENRRNKALKDAVEELRAFATVNAPRIGGSIFTGKKLSRRLGRRVESRKERIQVRLGKVLENEMDVRELHALRKDIKKLRYTLELLDHTPAETRVLEGWQEYLGTIHDFDVALDFIGEDGAQIDELRRARHSAYLKFVEKYETDSKSLKHSSVILLPSR